MMFNEDNYNGHMCNFGDTNIDQVEVTWCLLMGEVKWMDAHYI